jgi:hypothetical protein
METVWIRDKHPGSATLPETLVNIQNNLPAYHCILHTTAVLRIRDILVSLPIAVSLSLTCSRVQGGTRGEDSPAPKMSGSH